MFSDTLNYWTNRKRQYGDKCVGNVAEDHVRQGNVIAAELTKVLGGNHYMHGLDYGCGYGRLTKTISDYCGHLWAADLFGDWTGRASAHKTVTPTILDAYKLPFDDGAFDLVVDIMTLQSIKGKDWQECAEELSRVVPSGGAIISLNKGEFMSDELISLLRLDPDGLLRRSLATIDKNNDVYCLVKGVRL